jgi:hypothetical protein
MPDDTSWAVKGRLVYRRPIGRVLIGVLGEPSGLLRATYVWRVSMPLFVPAEHLTLSWSRRVGGGAHAISDQEPDEVRHAVEETIATAEDEVDALGRMARQSGGRGNVLMDEVSAYACLLLGKTKAAQKKLAAATSAAYDGPEWVHETAARVQRFNQLLINDGPPAALRLLDDWVANTVAALRLGERTGLRTPPSA